ncbi:MAG: trimethylamine methyltransferase family protein [Arenicellales bacterium]|nr:trimethylamine methyltransferase family protein [Arenicellales bacterium]
MPDKTIRRPKAFTPKRRGGHMAKLESRKKQSQNRGTAKRNIPTVELLDEDGLEILERHADWILSEIGIEFRGDAEALDLFRQAGATVKGERVQFDPGHAKALCATAPSHFVMHARDPDHSIIVGDNSVSFTPGYGSPFVTDNERGRRYSTLEDFQNFIKLTYSTPWLHHSGGTVCEPVDVPVNKRHLDMVYAHVRYSTKPFMGSVTAPERAQDSIDMAKIVFGENFMQDHCVIQGNINLNSPLVLDGVMSGALKTYARANQCVFISPFLLGGAMGPVTQPALIAQAHAETIAAIALTQLIRKGAPVVYGNFLTTLDLQTGAPTFGTPEATLSALALGQFSRRLQLPLRGIGHVTAAKTADGQAMQESADSMTAALMAGSTIVFHAAGWLEGGLTMGYEKFVMDLDRCGMMYRFLEGLTINDDQLARDAYRQAGPGENFLSVDHTLANFEKANYRSDLLANTQSFEQWTEAGSQDAQHRAFRKWKGMLNQYQLPDLDPAIDEALKDFIACKKQAMPDQWH